MELIYSLTIDKYGTRATFAHATKEDEERDVGSKVLGQYLEFAKSLLRTLTDASQRSVRSGKRKVPDMSGEFLELGETFDVAVDYLNELNGYRFAAESGSLDCKRCWSTPGFALSGMAQEPPTSEETDNCDTEAYWKALRESDVFKTYAERWCSDASSLKDRSKAR